MILLQVEATGLFSQVAQLGIVFTLLTAIIIVLARRVVKLEEENKAMMLERLEEAKEIVLIVKDATDAMTKVTKQLENGII